MEKTEIQALLANLGITIESKFVPFSRSRNKDEKEPSLNWIITLKRNNREVMTFDYSAGCGHTPAYNNKRIAKLPKYDRKQLIAWECEHGVEGQYMESISHIFRKNKNPIQPDICNVIHCTIVDADVLNYSSFEDWASNLGYDTDSRSAEKIYNECLKHGLALRNGLGEKVLAQLSEAFQDF